MNVIEIKKLNEAVKLMDKVLDGKTEHLKELKEAREIVADLVEFKNIGIDPKQAWKYIQE